MIISSVYVALTLTISAPLSPTNECSGCHFVSRDKAATHFDNGFGRWNDAQCFGCHAEIHQISENYRRGFKDARYFTLPVTDKRLQWMEKYPLPYLQAPELGQDQKTARLSLSGLKNFLQRPLGSCDVNGLCTAPLMMAYPTISLDEVAKLPFNFGTSVTSYDERQARQGELTFAQGCADCHAHGKVSKYSAAHLSLFSTEQIINYTHQAAAPNQLVAGLNKEQVSELAAYFSSARTKREQALDAEIANITHDFQTLHAKPLTLKERQYLWQSFWRDGGCVHCHGIEGRAKQRFDTSTSGLEQFLRSGRGEAIYLRLKIKTLEQKHGIGAAIAGMPMTGNALHPAVIDLVGRWIKTGCDNQQGNKLC